MRTAVCDGCHATGLERRTFNPESGKWEQGEHGTGEWRLFERGTEIRHTCHATAPTEANGMVSESLTESQVRKIAGEIALDAVVKLGANGTAPTLGVAAVRPVVDSVLGDMIPDAVAATVTTSRAKIAEMARAAIEDMVPVRHEIVVKRGGQEFHVAGTRPHRTQQDLVDLLNIGEDVFMVGPAGSGKTTAARLAAEFLGLRYAERSMGPQTSQWDLIGFLSPDGKYVPGTLRDWYQNGGVLMLDECDNGNASILTTLNSALANGHYSFPDAPEIGEIARHPNARLVLSGNTYGRGADRMYVGRQPLDAAFMDRPFILDWEYDEEAEREWAGDDEIGREWVAYVQSIRHAAFDLKMRVIVSPRASIKGTHALRNGIRRELVEQGRLWKGISADDRRKLTEYAARKRQEAA